MTPLADSTDKLSCPQCKKDYDVVDGIPVFAQNREHYYGFIPKEVITHMLRESPRKGWDEALLEQLRERPQLLRPLFRRAFDETRGAGKFLLSLTPQSRLLD